MPSWKISWKTPTSEHGPWRRTSRTGASSSPYSGGSEAGAARPHPRGERGPVRRGEREGEQVGGVHDPGVPRARATGAGAVAAGPPDAHYPCRPSMAEPLRNPEPAPRTPSGGPPAPAGCA
jgi:hypothetical protein